MSDFLRRVLIGALLVTLLMPLLPLLLWAFGSAWFFPDLLPPEWSLRAWRYVLTPQARVGQALINSILIGLLTTIFSLLVGLPAGRALALYDFRGKRLIELLLLAPTIVPLLAVAMGIHIAFLRYGLADTLRGVVFVHLVPTAPYTVLILAATFARYNVDFEAQARTLGASAWQSLRFVMWPLVRGGVAVAALFAFLISWSQYLLTLLIGGGRVMTLPVQLFAFATAGDHALTAALALLLVIPALLTLFVTARLLSGERDSAVSAVGHWG